MVKTLAKSLCPKQNSVSDRVCEGIIDRMADPVVYIIHNTKLTTPEVCSILLHPDCMFHLNKTMTKNVSIYQLNQGNRVNYN